MDIFINNNLYLKWIDKSIGWGVYTNSPIKKGDVIELCYCLLSDNNAKFLKNYLFDYAGYSFLPLGYGSIYNHSNEPNIYWEMIDLEFKIMKFTAKRDIDINEELLHDYGGNKYPTKKTII